MLHYLSIYTSFLSQILGLSAVADLGQSRADQPVRSRAGQPQPKVSPATAAEGWADHDFEISRQPYQI